MGLLNFAAKDVKKPESSIQLEEFLKGFSIEVMPRTAEKIESFRDLLPSGTRVYIAHLEDTPIEDMVATAKRIAAEGFDVMPHFPARLIKNKGTLENWIAMYQGEANISQALLLAGGLTNPHGDFEDSMQLLETDVFEMQVSNIYTWQVTPKAIKILTQTGR